MSGLNQPAGGAEAGLSGVERLQLRLIERAKDVVRPVARARFVVERRKYRGCTVLAPQSGNQLLAATIREGRPMAVAKIGAAELFSIRHYLAHRDAAGSVQDWGRHAVRLYKCAGVFPVDAAEHSRFARTYLDAVGQIDALAVWFRWGERAVVRDYAPHATYIPMSALEPFRHFQPWSAALHGKRVLVVSPFGMTIRAQYERRELVWAGRPGVLPDFEMDVLCPPPHAHLVPPVDLNWSSALARLKDEMTARDWDVAVIGAGAWSLPLAAHARALGRWGIHLGGATQLLFGVLGARWERDDEIRKLANAAWTRPSAEERPQRYLTVEEGCYW